MNTTKIYISLPADRDAVVTILARNGYTVRQGKEKKGSSKTYVKFVEFWKEGECGESKNPVGNTGTNLAYGVDQATVDPAAVP